MRPFTECDTRLRAARIDVHKFQSTHSITECDRHQRLRRLLCFDISIHALHYRVRRPARLVGVRARRQISIHALHYRVRPGDVAISTAYYIIFQSTHSITECDALRWPQAVQVSHFNPRTPLQSATATYSGLFCYITSCG